MEKTSLPWLNNKYSQLVILLDGAADEPHDLLGGKTPFQAGDLPNLKGLIRRSIVGTYRTIPFGSVSSSEVANLSILGYREEARSTEGRAGFEALGLGIHFSTSTLCYRCDIHQYPDNLQIPPDIGTLYLGVGHRHIFRPELSNHTEEESLEMLGDYLVSIGIERPKIWGRSIIHGIKFEPFANRYGFHSPAMISAVPVMWGIAKALDIEIVKVPGATGEADSNFKGKAEAAIKKAGEGSDFVYLHIEAPDEASHRKDPFEVKAVLERIDREVIGPIKEWFDKESKPISLTILPDHYTSSTTGKHLDLEVPYLQIKK